MPVTSHGLEKEDRAFALHRLTHYLRTERGEEEWGDLAVMLLLDTFEEQVAPLYYNRGIAATQKALREMVDTFEVNLEALKQYPPR